ASLSSTFRAARSSSVIVPPHLVHPASHWLPAHAKNSSATITGLPHLAAFFALEYCEPASATTSTSVLVLVSVGTATSPRASALACSSSLLRRPWTGESTVPLKQTRAPATSTAVTSTGPSTSKPSGSTLTP